MSLGIWSVVVFLLSEPICRAGRGGGAWNCNGCGGDVSILVRVRVRLLRYGIYHIFVFESVQTIEQHAFALYTRVFFSFEIRQMCLTMWHLSLVVLKVEQVQLSHSSWGLTSLPRDLTRTYTCHEPPLCCHLFFPLGPSHLGIRSFDRLTRIKCETPCVHPVFRFYIGTRDARSLVCIKPVLAGIPLVASEHILE